MKNITSISRQVILVPIFLVSAIAFLSGCGGLFPTTGGGGTGSTGGTGGTGGDPGLMTVQDVGTLGGDTFLTGINNSGFASGYSTTAAGDAHAILYGQAGIKDVGVLNGATDSKAYAISEAGLVVGTAAGTPAKGFFAAYLHSSLEVKGLGTQDTKIYGMDNSSATYYVGCSVGADGKQHAFTSSFGTAKDLGLGAAYGCRSLNSVGVNGIDHATLFPFSGAAKDLDPSNTGKSAAYAINSKQEIVGSYATSGGETHAARRSADVRHPGTAHRHGLPGPDDLAQSGHDGGRANR